MSGKSLFDLQTAARAAWTIGARRLSGTGKSGGPIDICLCIVDHFEPQHGNPEPSVARARLQNWLDRYPEVATRHRDAEGRHPAHTFCYPWDEYDEWEFERIAAMCRDGWGEVEMHLHHENDTSASLTAKLQEALDVYHSHGTLTQWPDGRTAFAFVHGNWALDNSRIENGRNFCGVNDELTVLQNLGCYADFTFPAWQCMSQPRQTNSIYYAVDTPEPKSYDRGTPAVVGKTDQDGLLIVQGPLSPYIRKTKKGPRLGIDDGDLAGSRRYHPSRLDRWIRAGIHVQGRPDRIFIKLHCHGAADGNRDALLGTDFEALFSDAEARYNDGKRYRIHYLTAREMYNVIKATEAGAEGDFEMLRDYGLKPALASERQPMHAKSSFPHKPVPL